MELKRFNKVEWTDLARVEAPSSGLYWARNNLSAHDQSDVRLMWVRGLRHVIDDPSNPLSREWNEHTRSLLLRDIEMGKVLVVQDLGGHPFEPLFKRKTGQGNDDWALDEYATWHPVTRHYGELALQAARDSIGMFIPPVAPEQKRPEKKPAPVREPVTVKNPRWEHVDKKAAEKRKDATFVGDTVTLKVDVTGVGEGDSVTFKVFDASYSPRFESR